MPDNSYGNDKKKRLENLTIFIQINPTKNYYCPRMKKKQQLGKIDKKTLKTNKKIDEHWNKQSHDKSKKDNRIFHFAEFLAKVCLD